MNDKNANKNKNQAIAVAPTLGLERWYPILFVVFALILVLTAEATRADPSEATERDIDAAFKATQQMMSKNQKNQAPGPSQTKMMWIWVAPDQREKMTSSTGEYVVQEVQM